MERIYVESKLNPEISNCDLNNYFVKYITLLNDNDNTTLHIIRKINQHISLCLHIIQKSLSTYLWVQQAFYSSSSNFQLNQNKCQRKV